MRALLIESDKLIASAIGRQLDAAKIQYDCVDTGGLQEFLPINAGEDFRYNPVIVGNVDDPAGCVTSLRRSGVNAVVLCLLDRRCATTTVHMLRSGADDVLVKPVASAEICARIEVAHRRAHGLSTNALPVGRLTVFLDGRDPEVEGERLRLSQREHAILSVLALNHRRVVSKDHIYEAVYGLSGLEPLDKVIDVYICKLRKKISAATGGGRYIETVYGRGFKLEAPPEHSIPESDSPRRIKLPSATTIMRPLARTASTIMSQSLSCAAEA